jgi:hypothetical protein
LSLTRLLRKGLLAGVVCATIEHSDQSEARYVNKKLSDFSFNSGF